MNKARLEWVMSGLDQHKLTSVEKLFVKKVSEDFEKKGTMAPQQEQRLEKLYKEKSR